MIEIYSGETVLRKKTGSEKLVLRNGEAMQEFGQKNHLYVIFSPSDKTEKTAEILRQTILHDGEDVFVPKIERFKIVHGNGRLETRELFPGYLFIETSDPESLSERLADSAKYRAGYVRLLKNDNLVVPLLPDEEKWYRQITNKEHVIPMSFGHIENRSVTIISGPLIGLEEKIVHVDRHKRIAVVKVPFLGEEKEVVLGLECP